MRAKRAIAMLLCVNAMCGEKAYIPFHRRLPIPVSMPAAESKWKAPACRGRSITMPAQLIHREPDSDYLARREAQARTAAAASADPAARVAHETMASRYAEQLKRA